MSDIFYIIFKSMKSSYKICKLNIHFIDFSQKREESFILSRFLLSVSNQLKLFWERIFYFFIVPTVLYGFTMTAASLAVFVESGPFCRAVFFFRLLPIYQKLTPSLDRELCSSLQLQIMAAVSKIWYVQISRWQLVTQSSHCFVL